MQGPRLPSHGAGRQITLQRLERPTKKEHEQDDDGREDQQGREAGDGEQQGPHTPPPPLSDQLDVLDDTGENSSTRCRSLGDDEKSNTCKRPSKTRLNKTVQWSRRHLRFIGPGLSECGCQDVFLCCLLNELSLSSCKCSVSASDITDFQT